MSDRNVKLFIFLAGLYFVSKDVGAIVLFSRRNNKNENQSNESEKLSQWRNQNERK